MLDEKKSRETWEDAPTEVTKDRGHSEPLETKGDDLAIVADGEDRTNFFIWLLVVCSSISGLLFGALTHIWAVDMVNACAVTDRLRHWCHLWCARYHRF